MPAGGAQRPEHPEAPSLPGQEAEPGRVSGEGGDRPGDSGHAPGPRLAVCPWQGHQLPELTAPPRPQDRAPPALRAGPRPGSAHWELAQAEGGAWPSHVSAFSSRVAKARGTSSSFACNDRGARGVPSPAQPRVPGSAQSEGALSLVLRVGLRFGFGAGAPNCKATPTCLSSGCCQVCSGVMRAGQREI